MAPQGGFTWNEPATRDVEAALRLDGPSLGRRFEAWPMAQGGTYRVAHNDDGPVGGLVDMHGKAVAELPSHGFADIAVYDVDARGAAAIAAGGTLVRPLFDVPQVGRLGIVRDPTGAVVGWVTPPRARPRRSDPAHRRPRPVQPAPNRRDCSGPKRA